MNNIFADILARIQEHAASELTNVYQSSYFKARKNFYKDRK